MTFIKHGDIINCKYICGNICIFYASEFARICGGYMKNNKENTNKNINEETFEIDLRRIGKAIWSKVWLIAVVSVLAGAIALLATIYLITPMYESSALFYVNNNSLSVGGTTVDIDSGDITASKSLVETYIVILNSREVLEDVIDFAEVDYTYGQLKNMLSASSVNSTEVFEVVITGPDPYEAEKIADAITEILPNKISNIVEGTSAKVVDYAIVASKPSSPNRTTNILLGVVIGFIVSVSVVVLNELFDNTIRSEEDIAQICNLPILAAVPDMLARSKGGYYYDVKKKSSKKKQQNSTEAEENDKTKTILVGNGISFAASEAYKLLRTKLQFSFADNEGCRVIGVSSALAGEGKSLSSVNLAHSLSQLGKRVMLIDCDMRRPSVAAKLEMERVPGLSNYLAERLAVADVIQNCSFDSENASCLYSVIAAGRIPPNPIELLSSRKMEDMLEKLKSYYDYIILDLPPVGEVSDAIVAAKFTDGVLMVACQNYCTRKAFSHAVEQFDFVDSKILGIVLNRVSDNAGGYGYKYGKRYYKKYYGRYGYGYASDKEQ